MIILFIAKQIKCLLIPESKTVKHMLLCSSSVYFVIISFILVCLFVSSECISYFVCHLVCSYSYKNYPLFNYFYLFSLCRI